MVVVALHGFLGCPEDWNQVQASLQSSIVNKQISFVCPDLVSELELLPASHDGLLAVWARNHAFRLRQILRERRIAHKRSAFVSVDEPVLLMGYSMGGRLAMHLLIEEPELFCGAVFVSAHPGLESEEEKAIRRRADATWAQRFSTGDWLATMQDWNNQPVFNGHSLERDSKLYERRAQLGRSLEVWSLGVQEDLTEPLGQLSVRQLVVAGEDDPKFKALLDSRWKSAFQKACVIGQSGHRVPMENPKALGEAIGRWLESFDLPC